MNKEYNIIQIGISGDLDAAMQRFNNKLHILRDEGWHSFGEPCLDIKHSYLTLILWRIIQNESGPYR